MFICIGFSFLLCLLPYSFVDGSGNQYSGVTTQIINGKEVLAINSPKVLIVTSYMYN